LIARDQVTFSIMPASSTLRPMLRAAAAEASGVSGSPAILWVGRLNANKDPLTVLDGFERARRELTDATLTMIYSEGGLVAQVRQRIHASPVLSACVRLVGAVAHERLAAYYS